MANMVGLRIAAVFALLAQLTKNFFAVNWLDVVDLDVIIATVKHVANLRQFSEVPSYGILDEVVRSATGCSGEFQETRFGFRIMYSVSEVFLHGHTKVVLSERFSLHHDQPDTNAQDYEQRHRVLFSPL